MLFSSVGFMKVDAQISITLPQTKTPEVVTITFTSSEKKFKPKTSSDKGSYPMIDNDEPTVSIDGATATYTLKTKAQESSYILKTNIPDDDPEVWGNITLTLNGKVSKFKVSDTKTNNLQSSIISLSFTSNEELSELVLGGATNAYTTDGLPNLKELSCSGNKLIWIPKKAAAMTKYEIGTQTPENIEGLIATPVNSNSKNGVTLNISKLSSNGNSTLFNSLADLYAFSIENAKDKYGKDVTTDLVGVNKAVYSFKQDGIFFDGDVTFDVKVTDVTNYPDVVIKGVMASIGKPSFAVKAEVNDEKMGKVTASPASQSVAKGTPITFTFAPKTGYSFKEVEKSSVKGLTFVEEKEYEGGNVAYTYTVKGNEDVSLKGIFEAQGVKVSFNEPEGGMFRITDEKGALIANGSNVPVGSKLKVVAIPREGYSLEVSKVTLSGSTATSSWEGVKDASDGRYEGEYTVLGTDKELIFNATFTKAAYKLSVAYSNVNSVKVFANGTEVTSSNSSSNPLEYSSIPFGATLKITLGLSDANSSISSVVFNAKEYKATKIANAQYEVSGITMPAMASQLTVEPVTNPNFTIVTKFTQTELTYTGQPLALPYEVTQPVGLEGFKVLYAETESGQYSETRFTNAGKYWAKIVRDADATHNKYESPQSVSFEITAAPLIIKEQPTVEIGKDDKNQDAYLFEGGKVVYMNGNTEVDVTKDGKFAPIDAEKECKADWKSLTVKFIPLDEDGELSKNLAYNVGQGGVKTKVFNSEAEGLNDYTVKVEGDVQMFNGATPITSGSKLKEGTVITFKYEKIGGNFVTYELYQVDNAGNKIGDPINNTVTLGDENHNKVSKVIFKLFVTDTRSKLVLDTNKMSKEDLTQEVYYNGEVKVFDKSKLKWATQAENGTTTSLANGGSAVNKDLKLTYFYMGAYDTKALTAGELVPEPVDAGKYRVQITRDVVGAHQPITADDDINAYLVIKPAKLTSDQVPAPTASKINKGQMLSKSILTGTASVAGTYKWNETDAAVDKTTSHKVIFVPDNKNYADFEIDPVDVQVTDKAILTLSVPNGYGRLEATDDKGYTYHSGDELVANTTLTIKGIAESDLYELDYLKVNGKKASSNTISVGSSSIDVEGYFKVKDTKPATCKVTFRSTSVPGVGFEYVTNPTTVTTGGSYSFRLTAHPSDLSRIKVSDGTNVYTNTNGSFTISNINSDITLTVSLDNPTPYTVQLTREYKEGDDVIGTATYTGGTPYHGATLRFVATPKTGYKFTGWTGITSTLATADVVVKSDLVVAAKFEAEDGTIDPNTECIVRTPYDENVPGVHINKQGINVVKIGSDFEFTVDAYEDDLKNVKVTVDGAELKPTSENKYVISKVQKSTEVKVTLANPTRIKVVVETETKNAKGYVMGHVDVEGLFSDSTCYYNTTIRLAAYPESGVEFMNWSDVTSNTQLIRELTITKELTIKPVFSGTPTGIEDIMAASIATGKGCVWVRGIANADVTIVSMAGRVQARQRISGDTRINVPAGIYVILLESGSDVKRAKVIVK